MPKELFVEPPYLGAAYYPEDWPDETIDADIHYMKEAGFNVMRMGEFAWSKMEPREGDIQLDWLERVVEKLAENGIASLLCTPSATPPAWLTSKYPQVLAVNDHGIAAQHGARRHVCPTDPTYRRLCDRITRALGERFGNNPHVIGWQIDNEVALYDRGLGCTCPHCVSGFHEWLKKRYGTIENLNDAWCLKLWSQEYDDFAQIPHPRSDTWHHPSLKMLYRTYMLEMYAEYNVVQADALHEYVTQPVGTDMMPTPAHSYPLTLRGMDIAQFNHYMPPERTWEAGFWYDFLRTLKPVPFWNTETSTCWNGSVTANGVRPEGFCRVNSWLPIALGGEAVMYWLWRAHWVGQELMHGSVLSSCGRPLHTYGEVKELGRALASCRDFLTGTTVEKPDIALHYSEFTAMLFEAQSMVNNFSYMRALMERAYRPIREAGFAMDVLEPGGDLEGYKIVYSPFFPDLSLSDTVSRIRAFIEQGGTWIVGPLSDNRNSDGAKFTHAPFGVLEEWAGVYTRYQLPGDPVDYNVVWPCGAAKGGVWYDGFEVTSSETKILATYTEGPLEGLAAAVTRKIGEGSLVLLGTMPAPEVLTSMMGQCGAKRTVNCSPNVLAVARSGEQKGLMVLETRRERGWIQLSRPMVDLITDQSFDAGLLEISPYQVLCLVGA